MAIPALNDAITIASQYYDSTKRNDVVGAAVRATEASVRAVATNTLPLATPIIERVGGWDEIDRWACQGLDKVEKAAPIITLPTKELVEATRRGVLGVVAGDRVIVPPTLAEAVKARANRMVDAMAESGSVRAAAGLVDTIINKGQTLLDKYLPKDKDDNTHTEPGEGLLGRAGALASVAGHRLYRTALITMRPDLKRNPDAAITTDMLVTYARSKAAGWYQEVVRETRPGEKRSVLIILARWPITAFSFQPSDLSMQTLIQRAKANSATAGMAMFIQSNTDAIKITIQRLQPTVEQSVERIRSTVKDVMDRLVFLPRPRGDSLIVLAKRLSAPVEIILQTVNPMLQEVSSHATARLSESWEKGQSWAMSRGRWAAEEGLVWGGVGLALMRLTPSIALKGIEGIRVSTSEVVKRWVVEAAVARGTLPSAAHNSMVPRTSQSVTEVQGSKG